MAKSTNPDREQYQKALMDLMGCRPVAYWPRLARKVGGVKAAVMVCQLLYWNGDPTVIQRDGWILKSVANLEEETGLTQVEQKTARKILEDAKVIECHLSGIPRIWHYRINIDLLSDLLIEPQSHSMDKSLNDKHSQRSTQMRRNVDRKTNGTFTHNAAQLNNDLKTTQERLHSKTTTSSSSEAIDEPAPDQEEEVSFGFGLSTEVIEALNEIGVFKTLLPKVAAAGLSDDELLASIASAAEREPEPGKTAALFMYRLENRPKKARAVTQAERDAVERRKKYGSYA